MPHETTFQIISIYSVTNENCISKYIYCVGNYILLVRFESDVDTEKKSKS